MLGNWWCLEFGPIQMMGVAQHSWEAQEVGPDLGRQARGGNVMPSTPSHGEAACPAWKGPLEDEDAMGGQAFSKFLLCTTHCKEEEKEMDTLVPVPLGPLGETYCKKHNEKIYYFCEKDCSLLCVLCRESSSHQAHAVRFLDATVQPYQDNIEIKKLQIEENFKQLHKELEKQKDCLLNSLKDLELQIRKEKAKYTTTVSEEVSRLGGQIKELSEKCQQPASELLQMKTFVCSEIISLDLINRIRDFHRKILTLPQMIRAFLEKLVRHLETDSGIFTLDPQTASPSLSLSTNWKSVKYDTPDTLHKQNPRDSPLRFECVPVVLGSLGFTTGRHCWQVEVQLEDGGGCMLGVAREDVRRKGKQDLITMEGIWAVFLSQQACWASTLPTTYLTLNEVPRLVCVILDYEPGLVSLLNAETQAPIFTFNASFSCKIFPFFAVCEEGSCLALKG
ncbi:Tripartite motif-containing protein 15 [Galemys pyrenaicus]|uniref:Tripartite motif-containing protein 15 n=1 Tax=Galemys pyrenaicus TaxID=202257 RepID=A0A8J5ZWJ0_GALPY|nr:Tripartite motif-containing protein 15 [Galemys pyrenaicus]